MSEEQNVCELCGAECSADELAYFNDQLLCSDCLDEHTRVCADCGARIWAEDNFGDPDHPLCERCYDGAYTRCENCDGLLRRDEANYDSGEPYCDSCYDNRDHAILDYSYKPEPIFYGNGPRFFGVELEIDGAGEDSFNAEQVLKIGNRGDEYIYCKHDGSLDEGFEIVTHPMTLEFHEHSMPWLEIVRKVVSMGYTSHQADTCGLHVHVSRTAFGAYEEQQDSAIARVLYFFEKHWEELLKFSRRTETQLQRWAARYGYKEHPKEILDQAKKGYNGGRYTCVNISNDDTIEFRMFRGTLKYNTIIATLQMVDKICDVALSLSDEEIKALSWTSFVDSIDREKYPELITYLKERRLYINEACRAEEEI